MKKAIIVFMTLILITGCGNKNKQNEDSTPTFVKNTTCSMINYAIKNDPDGISNYEFTMHVYYNNLDDEQAYLETFGLLEFNSWNEAKIYYGQYKQEYKNLNIELSEEDIDTNNIGTITLSSAWLEKNTPRNIIEEQKNKGFECTTYDEEKHVHIE